MEEKNKIRKVNKKDAKIVEKTLCKKKALGNKGEALAVKYLKKIGYKILDKNYKNKIGEIDIVCSDKDYIVFVEVKTRTSDFFGMPREAVNLHKQNKIRSVASLYLMGIREYGAACRFDVVEILDNIKIEHIINAF